MFNLTRRQAFVAGSSFLTTLLAPRLLASAAVGNTLNIAYNVNLPSFDPDVGPSSVDPTIQAIYRSIFDQYIGQKPNLAFEPGLLTGWGWNDDKSKVWMDVRQNVVWHDGTPFTPEDVIWSIQREGKPDGGNPVSFIWAGIDNFKVDGKRITADVKQYDPVLFKWMAFLTGYVLPKAYYEKVGPQGFEKKPIGTGPYMVDAYEGNAYLRLNANPKYWGGKPAFETVVFKFVPDATSRVAEIESGSSDVTLEVPYEEFDRLKGKAGLEGVVTPISDIGMIFITNIEPMLDKNVRQAMCHAVDKQIIIKKLLRGYGVAIDTLEAPEYAAFDPSIKVPYDPALATRLLAASGFSKEKPVKFTIQTTRGFKPKDYEMIQVIVGMWHNVGIDAKIEIYEIAKHFELRMSHKLAPAAFYNWSNAIGDPTTSTGFSMYSRSPHSAWHSDDLDAKILPLWGEKDEAKRIHGWKGVDRYIAENAYVLPLLQYAQLILYKSDLNVTPHVSGALQPRLITRFSALQANLSAPAAAAPTISSGVAAKPVGSRVALVIGNSNYSPFPRLPNPRNDAEDLAKELKDLGFDVLLGTDLKRADMEDIFIRFAKKARESDTALVYYAGHGLQYQGINYLAPVDARIEDETDLRKLVNLQNVIVDLQNASHVRILIVDACRDNEVMQQLASRLPATRSAAFTRGLASVSGADGTLIAFATQPNRVAADGQGRNSPFAAALLKNLPTPGLELRTLMTRVRAEVVASTGGTQRPEVWDSLVGEFAFQAAQ